MDSLNMIDYSLFIFRSYKSFNGEGFCYGIEYHGGLPGKHLPESDGGSFPEGKAT